MASDRTQTLAAHRVMSRARSPSITVAGPENSEHSTPSEVAFETSSGPNDLIPDSHLTVESSLEADRLRRFLRFHFMNPWEKWKARRQLPWKLFLQIIKIPLVTIQMCLFASLRINHIGYLIDTTTVLRHLFLGSNWTSAMDVVVYPPATGPFSVYTKSGFYNVFGHAIRRNFDVNDGALTALLPDPTTSDLDICWINYRNVTINPVDNLTHVSYDITREEACHSVEKNSLNFHQSDEDLGKETLDLVGFKLNRLTLIQLSVDFWFRTVHLNPSVLPEIDGIACYRIKATMTFDMKEQSGRMGIGLESEATEYDCHGEISGQTVRGIAVRVLTSILDWVVIVNCVASFILCGRALVRAQFLRMKTEEFFERVLCQSVTWSDKMEFINFWFVMIVVNDFFIVIGTFLKFAIESRGYNSDLFTATSLLLGLGTLLVWLGVLRYMKFFSHYNVLIRTLKKAMPNVLRFMVCAAMLYLGFLLCGWVVLGPYSLKFRNVLTASECLFSLINGDDMFATFFTISDVNPFVKGFGRLYLYVFISLFIYVVLSLFISIIMDAYEVIKETYDPNGIEDRSAVLLFMKECVDTPRPGNYEPGEDCLRNCCDSCLQKFKRRKDGYDEIFGQSQENDAV